MWNFHAFNIKYLPPESEKKKIKIKKKKRFYSKNWIYDQVRNKASRILSDGYRGKDLAYEKDSRGRER